MIQLDVKGRMTCDAQGCSENAPGKIVLSATGGFAFRPGEKGWQFAVGPNGVFLSRCPKHKAALVAPNGQPAVLPDAEPATAPPTEPEAA